MLDQLSNFALRTSAWHTSLTLPTRFMSILLPGTAALSACLWGIQQRQVWRDEHSTWWAATLPFTALAHLLSHVDAVIAPYYLFMRGFLAVAGESALALRLPSALFMALCAALIALLGERLFDTRIGFWAGLLFAILPSVSRYGQEARPYALVLAVSVASALLLLRALADGRAISFLRYGLSVVLLGSLHLVALAALVAHPVLLFDRLRAADVSPGRLGLVLRFVSTLALALLALLPLAYLGRQQADQIAWTHTLDNTLSDLPRMLFVSPRVGRAMLVLGVGALLRPSRPRLFVASWAILPLLLLYLTQPLLHLFIHRYMLFVVPAWCFLCALTLSDLGAFIARVLRLRFAADAVLALSLALLLYAGRIAHVETRAKDAQGKHYDYAGAALLLKQHARASDAVAFAGPGNSANWARMAMQYELRNRPALRDVFVRRSSAETGWFFAEECAEPVACLAPDVQRLWLVTCSNEAELMRHMPSEKAELLEREFAVRKVVSLHNLSVALLERRRGS